MKAYFIFIGLAILSFDCHAPAKQRPPNIIYILADDLGYGELGCYGQQMIETPNLDRLAREGMRFTDHYAGAPVCAPSRCVLLTGQHGGHAFIRGNDEWRERGPVWDYVQAVQDPNLEGQRPLSPDSVLIPELLKQAGYVTGMIGKWGLGAPLTDGIPNNQGFDFFYGYNCQRQAHNLYPPFLWKDTVKEWLHNQVVAPGTRLANGADTLDIRSYDLYHQSDYAPERMHEQAIHFMRTHKDQPFFLYYASPLPHLPLQAPDNWVQHYVDKFGNEPPYTGRQGYFPNRYPHAAYAAMISYLDEQVGDLMSWLITLGLEQNTLIIFSSDNGPTYTGGADTEFFDSAKPFKTNYGYGKGFVHEGGIRVPMIVRWPGHVAPGSTSHLPCAFYDVLPTLCDVAGVPVDTYTDGISFLPTLLGKKDEQKKHDYLYWELAEYTGQQAVRMGKWKGIRDNLLNDSLHIALFDLEADPQELHDVGKEHLDILDQIQRAMEEAHIPAATDRFRYAVLGESKKSE
ncbi:MAG: arylsulfatase [Saprospiraceae bacterium]|nr:arylsulfatase [Saprospiraceae bacterium]